MSAIAVQYPKTQLLGNCNAGEIDAYCKHRDEVRHFTDAVSGGQIEFAARSYRQLWAEWRETSTWEGMAAHLSHLEERYSFSI